MNNLSWLWPLVAGSHRWGFFKPNVFVSQMAFPGADGDTLPDIDGNEADYDNREL